MVIDSGGVFAHNTYMAASTALPTLTKPEATQQLLALSFPQKLTTAFFIVVLSLLEVAGMVASHKNTYKTKLGDVTLTEYTSKQKPDDRAYSHSTLGKIVKYVLFRGTVFIEFNGTTYPAFGLPKFDYLGEARFGRGSKKIRRAFVALKENGETVHVKFVKVGDDYLVVIGSKNVHFVAVWSNIEKEIAELKHTEQTNLKEELKTNPKAFSRFSYAIRFAETFVEAVKRMPNHAKFIARMAETGLTFCGEHLSSDSTHLTPPTLLVLQQFFDQMGMTEKIPQEKLRERIGPDHIAFFSATREDGSVMAPNDFYALMKGMLSQKTSYYLDGKFLRFAPLFHEHDFGDFEIKKDVDKDGFWTVMFENLPDDFKKFLATINEADTRIEGGVIYFTSEDGGVLYIVKFKTMWVGGNPGYVFQRISRTTSEALFATKNIADAFGRINTHKLIADLKLTDLPKGMTKKHLVDFLTAFVMFIWANVKEKEEIVPKTYELFERFCQIPKEQWEAELAAALTTATAPEPYKFTTLNKDATFVCHVLMFIGASGSGKSTVAQMLATWFNLNALRNASVHEKAHTLFNKVTGRNDPTLNELLHFIANMQFMQLKGDKGSRQALRTEISGVSGSFAVYIDQDMFGSKGSYLSAVKDALTYRYVFLGKINIELQHRTDTYSVFETALLNIHKMTRIDLQFVTFMESLPSDELKALCVGRVRKRDVHQTLPSTVDVDGIVRMQFSKFQPFVPEELLSGAVVRVNPRLAPTEIAPQIMPGFASSPELEQYLVHAKECMKTEIQKKEAAAPKDKKGKGKAEQPAAAGEPPKRKTATVFVVNVTLPPLDVDMRGMPPNSEHHITLFYRAPGQEMTPEEKAFAKELDGKTCTVTASMVGTTLKAVAVVVELVTVDGKPIKRLDGMQMHITLAFKNFAFDGLEAATSGAQTQLKEKLTLKGSFGMLY